MSRKIQSFDEIENLAKELGYDGPFQGRKHIKFFHPITRRTVTVSSTPSCCYGLTNAGRDLRRNARVGTDG